MQKLLIVGAAVAAMSATFTLHSAEKESAAFALYTGIDSSSVSASTFLSRYRTSGETASLAKFSSEKPSFFVIIVQ